MAWEEDESTGEEWWQGSGPGSLLEALEEADPDSIVYLEVDWANLEDYPEGAEGPGSMAFFEHGIRAGNLRELLPDTGRGVSAYFSDIATEYRGATRASGWRQGRLFFLERYTPHTTPDGKKH